MRNHFDTKLTKNLEKTIGYSISINKQLFLKDLRAAVQSTCWKKESFLYGCILGDAYINKFGVITFAHGWKQKGFLMWKFLILQQWDILTKKCYPTQVVNFNKKRKKYYISYRFNTKSLFKTERALFYPEQSKVLPFNFEEMIDAQILALWFMDDGGLGGNTVNGLVLDVSGFTSQEQFRIKEILDKKFHLKTSLHYYNKEKNYVKLYFKKQSVYLFKQLIQPYVIPSLQFKLQSKQEIKISCLEVNT